MDIPPAVVVRRSWTKRYGLAHPVVDRLDFEIPAGTVRRPDRGPTAPAKTTILRMLLGAGPPGRPAPGAVIGQPITKNRRPTSRSVGALIEGAGVPILHPGLSGARNLARISPTLGGIDRSRVPIVLPPARIGRPGYRRPTGPTRLGMRQRLGIAAGAPRRPPPWSCSTRPTNGPRPVGHPRYARHHFGRSARDGRTVLVTLTSAQRGAASMRLA